MLAMYKTGAIVGHKNNIKEFQLIVLETMNSQKNVRKQRLVQVSRLPNCVGNIADIL